jgi:hypothetical protein
MQAALYNSGGQSQSKSRFMFLLEATSMTLPTKRASGPASAINARNGNRPQQQRGAPCALGLCSRLRLTHLIDERHDAFG